MNEEELVAQGDRNYYEAWSLLSSASERGDVRDIDGILIASPGSDIQWLNIAFITRPLADPEAQLRRTQAYFAERKLSFLVRIREELDEATERAAERLGMPYMDTIPGMALDPMPRPTNGRPPVEIEESDRSTFDTFVSATAASFDIPIEAGRKMLTPRLLDAPNAHWYVGLLDGTPVATSALITSERVAGVHFVSTVAAYRGRGIGEAMTRHAVLEGAKRGLPFAYLQASEMGYPIYERMGFRRVTGYKTFVPQES